MLQDYFEPFVLLLNQPVPDGMGSQQDHWQPDISFRGALTHDAGREVDVGGRMTLQSQLMLLHEFDVTLAPGDRVQRLRDSAIYRICGQSGDMRTPAFAGLQFAQVPVERLVIPA